MKENCNNSVGIWAGEIDWLLFKRIWGALLTMSILLSTRACLWKMIINCIWKSFTDRGKNDDFRLLPLCYTLLWYETCTQIVWCNHNLFAEIIAKTIKKRRSKWNNPALKRHQQQQIVYEFTKRLVTPHIPNTWLKIHSQRSNTQTHTNIHTLAAVRFYRFQGVTHMCLFWWAIAT